MAERRSNDRIRAALQNARALREASRRGGGGSPTSNEAGAILILALVLLLVGVLVIGGLAYAETNNLDNTAKFKSVRNLQYAATASTNLAIQNIRYAPLLAPGQTLNASPPSYCWGSGPTSQMASIDGVGAMASWCSTAWTPTSASTRVVTISTCLASASASACAAAPLLQAVATFDDYPPGISPPTQAACFVYCGTTMAITSWVWSATVPTVTSLSATSGSIIGGTPLTITGTGFSAGSTVKFIEEAGGAPTPDNVVAPAANVNVTSSTTITATSPAIMAGSTYFVVVTTTTGTSAYASNLIFTYSATVPTVASLSPSTSGVAGGVAVTIKGTGFMIGSTVTFAPTSCSTSACQISSISLVVTSPTTITAVAPAVTAAGTSYVRVTTPAGTSATGAASAFTYFLLVPTVSTVSPSSGSISHITTITITGTGFVNGATVLLSPVSGGGGNVTPSNVTVTSPTTITAQLPTVSSGVTYFVNVTVSGQGTSSSFAQYQYTTP